MDKQKHPETDENEEEFDNYLGNENGAVNELVTEGWDEDTEHLGNPFPYFVFIHQLLNGAIGHLRSVDQLIYLHLVRETFGRGRTTAQIAMRELGMRTGLGKRAVEEALKRLLAEKYLSLTGEGKGKIAATYRVHRRLSPPRSTKQTPKPSVESTLSQLDPEDYQTLITIARSLPLIEKEEFASAVKSDFESLGLQPDPPLLRQAFLYRVLESRMFHKIRQKYPTMFS